MSRERPSAIAISPAGDSAAVAESYVRTALFMDTLVTIEVPGAGSLEACAERVEEAFGWFALVESHCSRFDPASELSRLSQSTGVPVKVSPLLFRALEFALAVAGSSGGAFDPTVGRRMVANGFDQDYRTGRRVAGDAVADGGSYLDVRLDATTSSVTLERPLVLDLGAVAKGFAIDLAATALRAFPDFAIAAGGDLFVRGRNPAGEPWAIGIRHPREPGAIFETLRVSNAAVCTSGDYERPAPAGEPGHHIIEPRPGHAAAAVASVTVVAPTAMAADALATAAFVLGPGPGIALLEEHGVEGLIVTPPLASHATRGFGRYRQ